MPQDVLVSELAVGDLSERDVAATIDTRVRSATSWDGIVGLSLLNRFR